MNNITTQTPGCIKQAVVVVGNKWTALIVRELASGPKRFCELERELSLNPRTLTQRIDSLLDQSIIARTTSGKYKSYELTAKGADLIPVLEAMADWGSRHEAVPASQ